MSIFQNYSISYFVHFFKDSLKFLPIDYSSITLATIQKVQNFCMSEDVVENNEPLVHN